MKSDSFNGVGPRGMQLGGATDDKAADPVGTWNCEYEIGGQQRTSTLEVKKDGDKFTGTMSWTDQKERATQGR